MTKYTIEATRWRVKVTEAGKSDRYSEKEFESEDAAKLWAMQDERGVQRLDKLPRDWRD